jgi:HemY protein
MPLAVAAGLAVVGGLAWQRWRDQKIAAVIRVAVPALPDLARWPDEYAARLRLATAAARRREQPVEALRELARMYHSNNLYREAKQAEQGLAILEPNNPLWSCYLADACQNLGDQDGTRVYLEKTVRLAPDYPPPRLKLGDLYFKQGDPDAARAQYAARLRLVPADPYARMGLARIAEQAGDLRAARRTLEAIVRDNPDFYSAHNLLAEVYDQQGDAAAAAKERENVEGRFYEAEDPWLSQVYAWSFDPFRLAVPGIDQKQHDQRSAALPFYERAVRLSPGDGLAYDALAQIYRSLHRLTDARAALEMGLAAAPRTPVLYATLAQVLREQRSPFGAVTVLQRGVSLLPDEPALRLGLGQALEAAGRHAEALQQYREGEALAQKSGDAASAARCASLLGQTVGS